MAEAITGPEIEEAGETHEGKDRRLR